VAAVGILFFWMELLVCPGRWLLRSQGFDFLAVSINRRLPREPVDLLSDGLSINRRLRLEPVSWLNPPGFYKQAAAEIAGGCFYHA